MAGLRKLAGAPDLLKWLGTSLSRPSISAVSVFEIFRGMRSGEEEQTEMFLSAFNRITLRESAAKRAGHLCNKCRLSGLTIKPFDAIIAATAIDNNMVVVTMDGDFEKIDGVQVMNVFGRIDSARRLSGS